jgi:anthranilate phosphoribosyltransferase
MTMNDADTESTPDLSGLIDKVRAGFTLSVDESERAFDRFMDGSASPEQMRALLVALREKGHAPSEVAGGVRALRRAMIPVDAGDPGIIVDTCGTGGGSLTTFNISTAAAFVAAGAGVRIAKHGNRSFTSRSGSADVLEALGVRIETDPAQLERIARDVGLVFLFAPAHHPAMRHVAPGPS